MMKAAYVLLALLLLPCVIASAGVSGPAKSQRMYDFEPGKVITQKFWLHGAPRLDLLVKGAMSDRVEVDDPDPHGGERWVTMRVTLPQEMEPGLHTIYVGAMEADLDHQGMFGGRAGSLMGVYIKVLSDEPVVKGEFWVEDVSAGSDEAPGKVVVESWTKQAISSLYVEYGIDENGTLSPRSTTAPRSLASNEETSFDIAIPTGDLQPGEYQAQARVRYAGKELVLNETFRVGTRDLSLKEYPKEITIGRINKFTFSILSKWNLPLKDVYGVVRLNGTEDTTPTSLISPFSRRDFSAYLDASEMSLGEHEGTITIHFEERKKQFPITVKVVEEQTSASVQAEKDPEKQEPAVLAIPLNTVTLLYLLVAILVIINVVLLLRRRRP